MGGLFINIQSLSGRAMEKAPLLTTNRTYLLLESHFFPEQMFVHVYARVHTGRPHLRKVPVVTQGTILKRLPLDASSKHLV